MSGEIHGEKSYLYLAPEATWGTTPGSPGYIFCPVNSYEVRMQRDRRNAQPFVGLRQRKHGRSYRGMPSGSLATGLYGIFPGAGTSSSATEQSVAEHLLRWAFDHHESVDLPSKLAEWAEGPDVANRRHNGLRVNGATLEGSANGGAISISLELMGKAESELATAQTLPADMDKLVEFDFADSSFTVGGAAISLESFRLTLANNLTAAYLNSTAPSHLSAGNRVLGLQIVPIKNAATYDALGRAFSEDESEIVLTLKGLHNGTGNSGTNYTQVAFTLPRCAFVSEESTRNIAELARQPLNFECLKPDSSSNDLSQVWSQVA